MPLGDDYEENIEDYENGELSAGGDSDDECEEKNDVRQEEVAVLIYGSTSPEVKTVRTANCTEVEDATLIRAWESVSLDVVTGTNQTGQLYWQRIKDMFFENMLHLTLIPPRSYHSLQCRWDNIKNACR